MNESQPSLRIGLGILAAALCAAVLAGGLAALAKPAAYAPRRAALDEQTAQAERLARLAAEQSTAFGARPVCAAADAAQLARVRQDLQAAAGGGVKLVYLALDPSSPPDHAPLTPVALQLRAEGPYDALGGFLDRLAAAQPAIFVDRLDFEATAPTTVVKLTGKVFCWTSAQP